MTMSSWPKDKKKEKDEKDQNFKTKAELFHSCICFEFLLACCIKSRT